jgi:mono/diheme cytochrome c family protein
MKTTFALVLSLLLVNTSAFAGDVAKGKSAFASRCASCHGLEGAGDGPVSASLPPASKPANLKDGKYKFATDAAKFKELMQKGGAAVGLNPLMTGAPGASDAEIDDLYAFVSSLKK